MKEVLTLTVDGTEPMSAAAVAAVQEVCDRAETLGGSGGSGILTIHVSGAPSGDWTSGLDVMLVSKWERALRRLERLPVATVAVAGGDCGGTALDVFLAADVRAATNGTRLMIPLDATATWPGMAGYRLVALVGMAKIRRAVLFGLPIEAPEALRLGIVDEIVDEPAAAAAAVAGLASGLVGKELAIRRQLLFDAATTSFEDALGPRLAACDRALRGTAQQEAS